MDVETEIVSQTATREKKSTPSQLPDLVGVAVKEGVVSKKCWRKERMIKSPGGG